MGGELPPVLGGEIHQPGSLLGRFAEEGETSCPHEAIRKTLRWRKPGSQKSRFPRNTRSSLSGSSMHHGHSCSKPGRKPNMLRTGGTRAARRLPFVKSTFGRTAHFGS